MNIVPEILEIVAYVISAASVITALTPTPKDDALLAKVVSFVRLLGLNVLNARPK
jgi:hypothetical protein